MKNTKSPITDKPLRNPGQSLEEMREKILYDKVAAPVVRRANDGGVRGGGMVVLL